MANIRMGFVSNSSSSNFIIPKGYLTPCEQDILLEKCERLGIRCCNSKQSIVGSVDLGSDAIDELMHWIKDQYGSYASFVRLFQD